MYIYTLKKQKLKKNPQGGCRTSSNVPKLGVSGVKDTAKTNNNKKLTISIILSNKMYARRTRSFFRNKNAI